MSKTKKGQGKTLTNNINNNINNEVREDVEASLSSEIGFLEKLPQIKLLVLFSSIIILMLAWIYKGFIWGKYAYMFRDIGSDSYNLIYPQFYHHASYLEKFGSMPKWSFQQGLGQNVHPFWFDPISSVLFLIFKTNSASVMIWMQVIYMFLAGIFFFLYLKSLQLKNFPSLIGGFLFTFCGYVIIGGTWTVDKFPLEVLHVALLLYSVEQLLFRKNWILFPIAIALVGIHQPFDLYLYSLMLLVYVTARYAEKNSLKTLRFAKYAGVFLGLGLLGIGLGSFQTWSNLQQMIDSPRVSGNYSYGSTLKNIPIFSFAEWKEYSTVLLRMFSSDILGDGKSYSGWQNYMEAPIFYCGFLSLLLTPQLFFQLNRKQKIIYGTLIGLCLILIIFPYFRYAFWLFTGDYYRTISLLIVSLLLFYSMRALNYLYETGKINLIALGITALVLLLIINTVASEGQIVDKGLKSIINIFIILYTGLLVTARNAKLRVFAFVLLGVFVIVEVIYFSSNSLKKRDAYTKQELNDTNVGFKDATIEAVDYLKKKDANFYRIEKNYASGTAIHGSVNDAKIQEYYGTRSYHSFNQLNYVNFLESVKLIKKNDENSSRWLLGVFASPIIQRLCGVKYFLTKDINASYLRNANQDSVAMFKDVKIFRIKDTFPLGVTFDSYISNENFEKLDSVSRQAILLQTVSVTKDFQARLKGFNETTSANLPTGGVTIEVLKNWVVKATQDTLQIKEFLPNQIKGEIQLKNSKILFLSIPYDKGWSASVDGKMANIEKVDAGLMGILLEKGNHKIELTFEPPYVKEGTYLSLFSVLLFGVGITFFNLRKKKSTKNQSQKIA
ncbi:hypothetical protein EMA8858_03361 [Emticicia aquatica]|uniref:Membrane protein YfhO n=1 Tax=Emticicia aquatica TaxID=1681835 RepID=A0ABN8EZA2_9BACT|nr:YfhO family protein [Emticicia aquatica]CAH0997218.1 hypothetical protein EMA8858_03361 [Emticicia aquatica]